MNEISYGYCHCGCGQKTKVNKFNNRFHGHIAGEPRKFLSGHSSRVNLHNFKGRTTNNGGYILIPRKHEHPNSRKDGRISEHILIIEKVIGKVLPKKCETHHINGITGDNRNKNLVVCEDHGYHMLLHYREKAYRERGHANWKRCHICHSYDSAENIKYGRHKECHARYERERKLKTKA